MDGRHLVHGPMGVGVGDGLGLAPWAEVTPMLMTAIRPATEAARIFFILVTFLVWGDRLKTSQNQRGEE